MTRFSRYEVVKRIKGYIASPDGTHTSTSREIGVPGGVLKELCECEYLILVGKVGRRKEYKINPDRKWL